MKFSEKCQKGSVDMDQTRNGYRRNNRLTDEGAVGDQ